MLTSIKTTDYRTPECEVLQIAPAEILCTSPGSFGGSTEDMGGLEDILGGNN